MGEQFPIRQYRPADAERVLTVYELALEAHGWKFAEELPPDLQVTDDFLGISDDYLDVNGDFLVGIREGEIIATGGFRPRSDETAEIRKMAVHPDHQRRGYGDRMLVELEDRARSRGFDHLVLETFERLTAARSLYETHGYEQTHREPDDTFADDRIHYRKDL